MEIYQSFADKATSMVNEISHPVEVPPGPHGREWTSASVSQSGTSIMDIGPPAKQSLEFTARLFETSIVARAIECKLDFADANESSPFCLITATTVNRSSLALTPQTHLRIFHHRFTPDRRPFPHILHPDVEGLGKEREAPYTITFTVAQNFVEEGVLSSPTSSMMLKYILSDKKDRDILQSLIFGKTLLFSDGINAVITTGQKKNHCYAQQAVQMWLSKNRKAKSITVYFKDNKQHEKLYKEYRIHGLQSETHKLKPGAPIEVTVVEESPVGPTDSRSRSSTASAHTISSIRSAGLATSKLTTCCLHFSKWR